MFINTRFCLHNMITEVWELVYSWYIMGIGLFLLSTDIPSDLLKHSKLTHNQNL